MAANLQPITSDGGFTSGGNINSSGDPSAAPSLNDFFSITSAANFAIVTDNANTDQTWTFDDAGNLTLPLGSIVYETNIPDGALSGSAIALKPIGGTTANQQLLIYPTAADGDHIHLTSGNLYATELFLGSDNLYVKLANTGNVVINSNDGNSSNAMWTFDTAGNVTIPGNIVGAATIAIDNRDSGNTADIQLYSANEILIQARDRTLGSGLPGGDIRINAGDSAEDGDTYAGAVYISAGTGGESNLDLGGDGGVISIGAGDGGDAIGASFTAGNGGDVTINAGDAGDNNDDIDLGATGGDVNIIAGMSSGNGIPGGSVYINSGRGDPDSEGGPDGNVEIQIGNNGSTWIFDSTGNLTLPGNTFDVNYANGTQVSIGGGGNTGNVTFDDVTVQGVNQLNLSAGADFTANLAYLQVRSGDVASHIHFDTGNNEAYDLIVGNDDKFVQVSSTGNIIMSSYDGNTSYTWTLDTTGNLILAGGNSVIQSIANSSSEPLYPNVSTMVFTPDALLSSQSLVLDPTGPSHIHLRAPGANIDEPDANIFLGGEASSFEVGYYNGNVPNLYIHSNNNTWMFDIDGNITFPRDGSNISTDPYLKILGGPSPQILSEDASLAGPANLAIVADYLNLSGSTGNKIVAYPDQGVLGADANLVLFADFANVGNTNSYWTFDTTGNLTTPSNLVIGPGPGSGSSIFQYDEALQILGEGANSVVQMGWTANTSAPDSVTTIAMNYPGGGEGNILIAVGNNATTVNYWLFDNTGNLRLPGNTFAVNYANGTQVPVGVTQDITSNGAMSIMTYDGNLKYVNYATVEPSTGNIAGGNISTTGTVTANTAIITTGNITTINSGLLQNGNSNITITSNGNVSIQAAGSNVELVVTSTGANINGTLSVTGNANVGNLGTAGLVVATGNVTGGNLTTGGALSVTGNANVGNVNTGNVNTSGLNVTKILDSGNLTAVIKQTFTNDLGVQGYGPTLQLNRNGGIASSPTLQYKAGEIQFSDNGLINSEFIYNGNRQYGNLRFYVSNGFASGSALQEILTLGYEAGNQKVVTISGNANVGNLNTTTANITTGNITTINSGLLQNGNSNITITSNGNVSIQAAGSNVELVVTSTGANITGTLTSTGKIGYESGSTVTQTSNRGNGVNINALAGTIVTVSASMTAGEIGAFSVTNNQVDTNNDIVLVQVVSPNLGNYNVIANPNSGIGGFYLTLQNISGFPISAEAVTIRFMVIKAPNA